MHEGNNMGITTTLKKPTLERASPQGAAQGQPLSPQQHNAMAQHQPITGLCKVHGVQMKDNEKDGRHWFSHYDEAAGRWCRGK